ncbi:MAG: TonB-dependent receptor [Acidobacteriota bacterium]
MIRARWRCSSHLARLVVVLALIAGATPLRGEAATDPPGGIQGTVSTLDGSVKLPGAMITVVGADGGDVSQQVSGDEGRFTIPDLPPARYRVRATLDGFQPVEAAALVEAGGLVTLTLDLPIAAVSESVEVVARAPISNAGTLASSQTVNNTETRLLIPGEGFQAAVRLLSGVIEVGGGESIDGGHPNQASVQVGAGTMLDPATNLARLSLPAPGIDSVSVLPSPYEAEFGRFSSGLIQIQTKRAGDQWKVRLNDFEPAFRLKRYTLLDIQGIAGLKPNLEIGGPLKKGRVFLEQTAQYHYEATDVASRPESELRTSEWFSSFTRVDAVLSPRHGLALTGGFVPSTARHTTLGTFTPPDATADLTDQVGHAMLTERSLWGPAAMVETTVQFHEYHTGVHGQGSAPMELLPETTVGNFFNRQQRDTSALQWIETASGSHRAAGGLHLYKVGVDLLHSTYDGTSASAPVLIARSDGTLARRLEFGDPTVQSVHSTDVAIFAQDRLQPGTRWYVEFGGRIDHDGIADRSGASPRAGVAVLLNPSATAVLHGGYGLFYERTPSIAGAFQQFEPATDTRFGTDGVTTLGTPTIYEHVTAADLQTARSAAWDLAYDHRVNRMFSVHISVLDRQGSHQLVIDPVLTERGGQWLLSSSGRSSYLQEEVAVHVTRGSRVDVNASYVHSSAREDLNALVNFFDAILEPVVGANAYAPAPADAPHRLFMRGRAIPTSRWMVLGTLDWRSGLPYSIVDDALEFVGARNARRFPAYHRLDLALERRVTIAKWQPWLGIRAVNALDSFLPADVQANVGSPKFGSFYNSEFRQFRIHLRFER